MPIAEITEYERIEARAVEVFRALTLPEKLEGWWSNNVTAKPKAGEFVEVRFENGDSYKLEILELVVGKKVVWRMWQSPHGWQSSIITWELLDAGLVTWVKLEQRKVIFGPNDLEVDVMRGYWRGFVGNLRRYLQTGEPIGLDR